MVSISLRRNLTSTQDGLRPIDLRTDLGPLADLIELVFMDRMDSSGRAAVNEMRQLGRIGASVGILANVNRLVLGIRMGYVWIADGKLVGNVSVYPAGWPSDLGSAWIVANVAVHPDYQRRGIARRLMQASLAHIRQQGGTTAILQVDNDNAVAQHLYDGLGFVEERAWTVWRRNSTARIPAALTDQAQHLTVQHGRDWRAEYALAQRLRPLERGGLGWNRPLHAQAFHTSFWRRLIQLFDLQSTERLVIRADDNHVAAALWIESGLAISNTRLTLFAEPENRIAYADALIGAVLQRYINPLAIEHPDDETDLQDVLRHYQFSPRRSAIHMRWDAL